MFQAKTQQCQKWFFDHADVVPVPQSFASVGIVTEANAIAAPRAVKGHGGNRDVQPIVGTRGPRPVGEPTAYANDTIGFAKPGFA